MKRLLNITFIVAITVLGFATVNAQSEFFKLEGMGGYSYMNLNRGVDPDEFNDDFSDFPANRVNAHGFNGSVTYNFTRFIGAKFDVTLHTHGEDFQSLFVNPLRTSPEGGTPSVNGTFKTSQSVYQYMGGIQIKDNEKEGSRFRPFAHILLGAAQQSFSVDETAPTSSQLFKIDSTDLAMKFGGGADVNIGKHFAVRAIQFDWNPIFRGDLDLGNGFGTANGVLQNNWLLTFGVVLH
ncbi:MAG: outer membrane beta-barrel protein [Pyrinomonadaceae bacterium]